MMRFIPVEEDPNSFADYYGVGQKGGRKDEVVSGDHSV